MSDWDEMMSAEENNEVEGSSTAAGEVTENIGCTIMILAFFILIGFLAWLCVGMPGTHK